MSDKVKVEVLKSGKYALHPSLGPIAKLEEGQKDFFELDQAERMVADGWGKILESDENPDDENPDDENPDDENPDDENPDDENPDDENPDGVIADIAELKAAVAKIDGDPEKKSKIQDWGSLNCGIKVSKSKNPGNMIKELEKHIADNPPPE